MSQLSQSASSLTSAKTTMEAHQLPQDCYPPTDSDDESFVVLHSDCEEDDMPVPEVKAQLLQSDIIDTSLEQATEAILNSLTLQSLPAAPKMDSSMGAGSLDSVASSAINDELQQKVEMLLDENNKLSNSLNQNNIVMKNQYETLAKWQEDVMRVHESHRKKFAETKAYIQQLQMEYARLKHQIMTMSTSQAGSINTSIISKSELKPKQVEDAATSMESLKQDSTELQNVQADYDKQLQNMHTIQAELQASREEVKSATTKIEIAQQEVQAFKDKIVAQEHEINSLKLQQNPDIVQQLRNDLQKAVQEAKNAKEELQLMKEINSQQVIELATLKDQGCSNSDNREDRGIILQSLITELLTANNELQRLTSELNHYKELNEQQMLRINDLKCQLTTVSNSYQKSCIDLAAANEELVFMKSQHQQAADELDKLKVKADNDQLLLNKRTVVVNELMNEINMLTIGIDGFKNEINEMKTQLEGKALLEEQLHDYKKQVKANDEEYKRMEIENLETLKKRQKLLEDVTVLKCQLVKLRDGESAETQQLRIQLFEAQNAVVELKEGKKVIEKEAELNRLTIDDLDKKLKEAISDQDKLVALEQQLQIYRGDFESERENKIRLIEELNKVSDDLSNVHKRNRELIAEIEHLRNAAAATESFVEVPMAQPQKTPSPPLSHFPCPLCGEMFRSARSIEEHVDMCINNAPF